MQKGSFISDLHSLLSPKKNEFFKIVLNIPIQKISLASFKKYLGIWNLKTQWIDYFLEM
jgi:hypothetical protein